MSFKLKFEIKLNNKKENILFLDISYPTIEDKSLFESCCVRGGGTGEPPLSSDGVFDKNKLPPISETNVIGELFFQIRIIKIVARIKREIFKEG